jgi:hypothetical protein
LFLILGDINKLKTRYLIENDRVFGSLILLSKGWGVEIFGASVFF